MILREILSLMSMDDKVKIARNNTPITYVYKGNVEDVYYYLLDDEVFQIWSNQNCLYIFLK